MSTNMNDGVAAVAAQSAATLRQLATKLASTEAENVQLRAKVASYARADEVRALAREMESRGLSPELTFEEKVASVSRYSDLGIVRESIKLAGGGKLDLAKVEEGAPRSDTDVSTSSFEAFCLTGHSS